MQYSVVVHKDVGSDFGVTVPDLPGCFSAGQTFVEALESVKEAISCHLEGLLMDGGPHSRESNDGVASSKPLIFGVELGRLSMWTYLNFELAESDG